MAVDDGLHARALGVAELLHRGQLPHAFADAACDRLGDGVFGGVLCRAGQAQDLVLIDSVREMDTDQGYLPAGDECNPVTRQDFYRFPSTRTGLILG